MAGALRGPGNRTAPDGAVHRRQPYLAPAKTKTSHRTNELPVTVADALRWHLDRFPIRPEDITDETDPRRPVERLANLLFTRGDGRPIHRADWSHIWRPAVKAAGLPDATACATSGTTSQRS